MTFLTPRVGRDETASEWLPAALGADTVVLYMAAGAASSIAAALIEGGKPATTPVALVESAPPCPASAASSRRWRALRPEAPFPRAAGPVVMLVGEVLRDCETVALPASAEIPESFRSA